MVKDVSELILDRFDSVSNVAVSGLLNLGCTIFIALNNGLDSWFDLFEKVNHL